MHLKCVACKIFTTKQCINTVPCLQSFCMIAFTMHVDQACFPGIIAVNPLVSPLKYITCSRCPCLIPVSPDAILCLHSYVWPSCLLSQTDSHTVLYACVTPTAWPRETPGPRLKIKTIFPRYGDSHVKDKTVGETVLSLTWGSIYWQDDIFILIWPPRGWFNIKMLSN